MKDKCFMVLYWFLANIKMNQSDLLMSPRIPSPSHPSRLLPSTSLSSLSHTGNSHWISNLNMVMHVSMLLSPYIPPSSSLYPSHVHKSVLYVCASIAALQISSFRSEQIRSVAQSCLTLCDPMNRSTPGLPVQHQLPEFTQTHVHQVSDAIQPSHPLSSPSPPAPNPSQHQSLFQ